MSTATLYVEPTMTTERAIEVIDQALARDSHFHAYDIGEDAIVPILPLRQAVVAVRFRLEAAEDERKTAEANERIALQAHAAEIKERERAESRLVEHKQVNRALNLAVQRLQKNERWLSDEDAKAKRIRWLEGENAKLAAAAKEADARTVIARQEADQANQRIKRAAYELACAQEFAPQCPAYVERALAELRAPPKAPAAEPAATCSRCGNQRAAPGVCPTCEAQDPRLQP
jgi:hypothetical protein